MFLNNFGGSSQFFFLVGCLSKKKVSGEALLWGRLMHGYGAVILCSIDWGMWPTLSGLTIVLWACGSISGWHVYWQVAQT